MGRSFRVVEPIDNRLPALMTLPFATIAKSASQKLNQQVARTGDSQGRFPHDDIVNPQEECTPLYWLSIDIGSHCAFQIVQPNLLVQVHDRTMSPTNTSHLTSKIVAILASDAEDWRCLPCILPIHFSDHDKRRIGFVQSVILLVRTRLPKPIRQLLNNGANQTDGILENRSPWLRFNNATVVSLVTGRCGISTTAEEVFNLR